jgi:hypothetical protein
MDIGSGHDGIVNYIASHQYKLQQYFLALPTFCHATTNSNVACVILMENKRKDVSEAIRSFVTIFIPGPTQ